MTSKFHQAPYLRDFTFYSLIKAMGLPIYQSITLKSAQLSELKLILDLELNLRHPVVLNLTSLDTDQQREVIGLTENFFSSNNISFRFPYGVYFISDHEPSISKMPIVSDVKFLPKFFSQKEGRMNVKETHVIGKNKLLQQELKNNDAHESTQVIGQYQIAHQKIFILERERIFYEDILNKLISSEKING